MTQSLPEGTLVEIRYSVLGGMEYGTDFVAELNCTQILEAKCWFEDDALYREFSGAAITQDEWDRVADEAMALYPHLRLVPSADPPVQTLWQRLFRRKMQSAFLLDGSPTESLTFVIETEQGRRELDLRLPSDISQLPFLNALRELIETKALDHPPET